MNTDPPLPHNDGLESLREIRRRIFREAGGNLKKLGDRYRRVEAQHPEKIFDPREVIADAARAKAGR